MAGSFPPLLDAEEGAIHTSALTLREILPRHIWDYLGTFSDEYFMLSSLQIEFALSASPYRLSATAGHHLCIHDTTITITVESRWSSRLKSL